MSKEIVTIHVKLNLLFITMIGIGTVLFHCTLQYTHQLIDELPIFYLASNGALILFHRNTIIDNNNNNNNNNNNTIHQSSKSLAICLITILCSSLTYILLFTTREYNIHNIARGTMSTVFSILFLYVFVTISKTLNEIEQQEKSSSKEHGIRLNQQMKSLFKQAFHEFIFAILCWVLDNSCCNFLQSSMLPFYPQLHAFWHLFTCTGLYKLILILAYIEQPFYQRIRYELKYHLHVLPVLLLLVMEDGRDGQDGQGVKVKEKDRGRDKQKKR